MGYDPISKRISTVEGSAVNPTSRQYPSRSSLKAAPGVLTPSRPVRFNAKGQAVAVGGVPLKGVTIEGNSEAYAEGEVSQFGFECGASAEADSDTHGLSGAELHVAAMIADGVEGADSYWD